MNSRSAQMFAKRALDIAISVLGLLVLLPLFVLIAIAIKIDSSGPVSFRQERLGVEGMTFSILKFRSMIVDAPDGVVKNGKKDPRVTQVGAFLRRWSLDELPQLLNVIRGEMSLVGPRPDRIFRLSEYTETQKRRLLMKPGITGLAQVSGRNVLPWEQRYQLDVIYIDNWSLWLDIKILFKTIDVILSKRGVDFE